MKKPTIRVEDIAEQARKIRDIMQSIMDASESGKPLDPYVRSVATGGTLAGDVAVLGVMIIAREYQEGE